jgi:hypothetical protein
VSILKIADKWQCADTVDACRAAFAMLRRDDLDLEVGGCGGLAVVGDWLAAVGDCGALCNALQIRA